VLPVATFAHGVVTTWEITRRPRAIGVFVQMIHFTTKEQNHERLRIEY